MKLATYKKKRNFKKTPEPSGRVSSKQKHLYIIQKHAASHLHYDFRLEMNGVLLSWAIPKGPSLDPGIKRLAVHVEDHPVEYGSFEGIIPQGEYGGGTVMLWDKGKWIPEDDDPEAAYKKGHLRFSLKAKKLNGRWSLIRFKKDDKSWFLIKSKDKYARLESEFDVTEEEPNSVVSGFDLDEITDNYKNIWSKKGLVKAPKKLNTSKKKANKIQIKFDLAKNKFPTIISAQLATLVDKPPKGNDWLHEIKFDGYRILAFKKNQLVTLLSRNNKEWTRHFANIEKELKRYFSVDIVLDGEIVLLDENQHSNFQLLQNALHANEAKPFVYYIFDLLYYDKYNLMAVPLIDRKNILQKLLQNSSESILRYSDHIVGHGEKIFKKVCAMSLEGIVSKKLDSHYHEKRTRDWLKIKCVKRQEFVIGGYSLPGGSRKYFGSLFLGYYDQKGNLIFCGNVGTGFNQASLKLIYQKLQKQISRTNPFTTRPPGVTTAIWVKPILVAEVEFSEWTKEGILRHPSFKGLREDKPAKTIAREMKKEVNKMTKSKKSVLIGDGVELPFRLTNPNKLLYPEDNITKLDIAKYYDEIQEWILPYIVNRPLTLVRCPGGYKECFYQKHVNKSTPDAIHGIKIKEKDSVKNCIYIKDRDGLMALVQMATLEIHPWGCRIEEVEYPDMIIIDLDPAHDVPWRKVVAAAKLIKQQLTKYKLKSFVKTTGGKGLHVVVPIQPEYKWDIVKKFTRLFVEYIVAKHPNEYVSNMSKAKRSGKIYIDYLRNQRGATAVAPYSTRARPEATVSVPLAWRELTDKREDTYYTIDTVLLRLKKLKKDPWADFFTTKQSLRLDEYV